MPLVSLTRFLSQTMASAFFPIFFFPYDVAALCKAELSEKVSVDWTPLTEEKKKKGKKKHFNKGILNLY